MPKFKVQFAFGSGKFGWAETWWRDGDTLGDVAVPASTYLAKRRAFMPQTTSIDGVRISVEGESRLGSIYLSPGGPIGPGLPTLIIPPLGQMGAATPPGGIGSILSWDQARVAMQVYVRKAGRRYGTRYLAPVPDPVSGDDTLSLVNGGLTADWWSRFNAFTLYLCGGQTQNGLTTTAHSGWQIRSYANAAPGLEKQIVAWHLSAGAETDLQFELLAADALPLTLKDRVVIRGARMRFKGLKSPNGAWKIANIVAPAGVVGQLVTIRFSSSIDVNNISSLGLVRVRTPTYVQPDELRPVRCGIHKRGGRFFRTLGAARTRSFAP